MTTKTIAYPVYTLAFSFNDLSDPSKAVAVKYDKDVWSYFGTLVKSEVQAIYNLSMANLIHYPVGTIGAKDACEVLGFLADTYSDWVDEFENN